MEALAGRILLLAAMLPSNCTPILVTDAGFRRPWLQAVHAGKGSE